jgi:hypothetical protein
VNLTLRRYGGAIPGETDMATLGHPGKLAYCVGEREEASPWPALHVERGFSATDDVVTVIGADAPVNVPCPARDADAVLAMTALAMAGATTNNVLFGGEVVVVLCPAHAAVLGRAGLSKRDAKVELFRRAVVRIASLPDSVRELVVSHRPHLAHRSELHAADEPDAIIIVVAGGNGEHSAVIPTFGFTRSVSAPFEHESGEKH